MFRGVYGRVPMLVLCDQIVNVRCNGLSAKVKGPVFDIALLHNEHMLRSALQSRKWQLIGMS